MLSWLFGPKAEIPDDDVIYAIGDIHGRDDLLGRLHERIEADLTAAGEAVRATVIYLGDYVDRGPDSRAVIERLLARPVRGAESIHLKGNHEDAMLRFLAGTKGGERWLAIGGGATANSYGVSLRDAGKGTLPVTETRARLNAALPPRHLAFLRGLQLYHEAGDYCFVHAGIRPGLLLAEQSAQDLLWIRGEFLNSRHRHERIVVHGHSSGSEAVVRRNRICIDTAAYATDRLTCLVLSGRTRRFIHADL